MKPVKTSFVTYVALFVVIVCLGLVFFLPNFNKNNPQPQSVPSPTPVDTGTVSISRSPSEPEPVICSWCGQSCEPLGTHQDCQAGAPPSNYICQSVQNLGKTTCEAVLRSKSSIVCDAVNRCPDGKTCYSYTINGAEKTMCAGTDPCQECPSKKCQISGLLMYPGKVTCL